MQPSPDVLIVGGGVIGASIAFHLTARGVRRVVVCEQGGFSPAGATGRSAGMVRMHHSNRWQARLAWQSHATFAYWDDVVGGSCGFRQTGFAFLVGPDQVDDLTHNVGMLREVGVPLLVCVPDDFRAMVPACSMEGIGAVAYEPFSGYADPLQTTVGLMRAACRRGADFMAGAVVERLVVERGVVRGVRTNFGDMLADTVVLASNAGAIRLLQGHGVELPIVPKRIGICFVDPRASGPVAPACIVTDDTLRTYFRPSPPDRVFVGVAPTEVVTDLGALRPIQPEEAQDHLSRFRRRFPGFGQAVVGGAWSAVDGYTPDRHALIGPVAELAGVYVAAGFSGGGFKIAPAVGAAVAGEVIMRVPAPELEGFRLDRFARECPIVAERAYRYV